MLDHYSISVNILWLNGAEQDTLCRGIPTYIIDRVKVVGQGWDSYRYNGKVQTIEEECCVQCSDCKIDLGTCRVDMIFWLVGLTNVQLRCRWC